MDKKPATTFNPEQSGKKKHFGAGGGGKKEKDFIPSNGLTPQMKSQGFIVDKNLFKVGKLL